VAWQSQIRGGRLEAQCTEMANTAPVYLGDEVSAQGWRLAGVDVVACERGAETDALERACRQAPLVLVSAACAQAIDAATLRRAMSAVAPLVLVVPDPQGEVATPDLASRLRAQLGMQ
jgi:vacuolar-type H+-ATPase subunit F/Vma7